MAGGFDDVRQLCEAAVADRVVPGLVLLCAAGGRTLFHEAFGYRQVAPRRLRAAPRHRLRRRVTDQGGDHQRAHHAALRPRNAVAGRTGGDAGPRFPGPGQGRGHRPPPAGARIGAARPPTLLELGGGRRVRALGDLAHGRARAARVSDRLPVGLLRPRLHRARLAARARRRAAPGRAGGARHLPAAGPRLDHVREPGRHRGAGAAALQSIGRRHAALPAAPSRGAGRGRRPERLRHGRASPATRGCSATRPTWACSRARCARPGRARPAPTSSAARPSARSGHRPASPARPGGSAGTDRRPRGRRPARACRAPPWVISGSPAARSGSTRSASCGS